MEESIDYKGYKIKILQDIDAMGPREWDNMTSMYCVHRRYNLGDKNFQSSAELMDDIGNLEDCIHLPLYLYDHSGITMNTTGFSCQWDSGQVGLIFITKEKAMKEFGWDSLDEEKIQRIKDIMVSDVQVYDDYIRGDVYGYKIENAEGEEIDSCWGYYGYDHETSGLMESAKGAIDYHIESSIKSNI